MVVPMQVARASHGTSNQRTSAHGHSLAGPRALLLLLLAAGSVLCGVQQAHAEATAGTAGTLAAVPTATIQLTTHHHKHHNITGIPSLPAAGEQLPELWPPIPVCSSVLSKLSQADVDGLRDSMQALQQMTRRVRELEKEEVGEGGRDANV